MLFQIGEGKGSQEITLNEWLMQRPKWSEGTRTAQIWRKSILGTETYKTNPWDGIEIGRFKDELKWHYTWRTMSKGEKRRSKERGKGRQGPWKEFEFYLEGNSIPLNHKWGWGVCGFIWHTVGKVWLLHREWIIGVRNGSKADSSESSFGSLGLGDGRVHVVKATTEQIRKSFPRTKELNARVSVWEGIRWTPLTPLSYRWEKLRLGEPK